MVLSVRLRRLILMIPLVLFMTGNRRRSKKSNNSKKLRGSTVSEMKTRFYREARGRQDSLTRAGPVDGFFNDDQAGDT